MMIGIDLAGAPAGHHRGIDGIRHPVRYAPVRLRLSDGRTHLEWPATVGFTTAPLRYALLGFAGFFQFFTAEFQGDRERVALAANPLFPA